MSAWGSVGRTICVNTHPPATDCRFPWAGSKRIAIKECSPAELLDDPVVGLVTMSDGVDRPSFCSRRLVGRFCQALAPNAHIRAL